MKIHYYLLLIILIFINIKILAKEFIIRNNEDDFDVIKNINDVVNNEIVFNFVDEYYNITYSDSRYEITVNSNITFKGNKNGSIFDYLYENNRALFFLVDNANSKKYTIKFENIIFRNYNEDLNLSGMQLIRVKSISDNFYLHFDNCTFQNNYYSVVRVDLTCLKPSHTDPSIVFDNCSFFNNTNKVISARKKEEKDDRGINELNDCLQINIKNSNFEDNKGLFYINNGKLTIDNYKSFEEERGALYYSETSSNELNIKNSWFENIHVKSIIPLIYDEGLVLK
ncbi:hypothetical protein PIROE2DRAFT_10749 [Piromyces sp. E2]|nr:hypothetical protein PIROE2DRAFT_10749 [Piromyces sp. E2]|eukprot:OUM62832.1 hypothetical protein PIROE2DRAFT_10749 [Piromyces sp. E2]